MFEISELSVRRIQNNLTYCCAVPFECAPVINSLAQCYPLLLYKSADCHSHSKKHSKNDYFWRLYSEQIRWSNIQFG